MKWNENGNDLVVCHRWCRNNNTKHPSRNTRKRISLNFLSSSTLLFHFHFNLLFSVWWVDQSDLNRSKLLCWKHPSTKREFWEWYFSLCGLSKAMQREEVRHWINRLWFIGCCRGIVVCTCQGVGGDLRLLALRGFDWLDVFSLGDWIRIIDWSLLSR